MMSPSGTGYSHTEFHATDFTEYTDLEHPSYGVSTGRLSLYGDAALIGGGIITIREIRAIRGEKPS
jgi:hypothetical protein